MIGRGVKKEAFLQGMVEPGHPRRKANEFLNYSSERIKKKLNIFNLGVKLKNLVHSML